MILKSCIRRRNAHRTKPLAIFKVNNRKQTKPPLLTRTIALRAALRLAEYTQAPLAKVEHADRHRCGTAGCQQDIFRQRNGTKENGQVVPKVSLYPCKSRLVSTPRPSRRSAHIERSQAAPRHTSEANPQTGSTTAPYCSACFSPPTHSALWRLRYGVW